MTFIKTSEKNSKILRWRLELENFDYDVVYKQGKTNVVADALSRMPKTESGEVNYHRINDSDNDSIVRQTPSESETIHSTDTSNDYYIHFANRPINYYRNQIIFRLSKIDTIINEEMFPNFKRTTIVKESFEKSENYKTSKKFS